MVIVKLRHIFYNKTYILLYPKKTMLPNILGYYSRNYELNLNICRYSSYNCYKIHIIQTNSTMDKSMFLFLLFYVIILLLHYFKSEKISKKYF